MTPVMGRLNSLHERHRGQRAVLVANGPSLNSMELSFLRREIVIGVNKIYLGLQRYRFYPKYYVAVNRKVIAQSVAGIRALTAVKFIGDNGGTGLIQEDALTHLINTTHPPARFCKDLTQGMHEGWTVTYAALQVACFLGFSQVVIIGLDHRFVFSGEANQEAVLHGADVNHFCDHYFGFGQKWDNPDLARSEESYAIARRVFEADGRRIIDATVDGACTVFEKADYRQIFLRDGPGEIQ